MPPYTRNELRAAGWSAPLIDAALRRGDLVSLTRGALLPAGSAVDLRERCAAALSTQRDDAAISHRAAAVVHGFEWLPATWTLDTEPIDITAARDDLTRGRRDGLRRRIAALPDDDVAGCHGLRVTSPARTLVDLARTEPRLLAVQITDGALTAGHCTSADLLAVCARMVRVPNVRRAREAALLARAGVDSPQESAARVAIIDAGLPAPDVRLEIVEDGVLLARGDLGYLRWLIWIEYDGWSTHGDRPAFAADRFRDRWLARRGWEVMRLYDADVRSPRRFLEQLLAAVREAPARIAALDASRSPEAARAKAMLAGR